MLRLTISDRYRLCYISLYLTVTDCYVWLFLTVTDYVTFDYFWPLQIMLRLTISDRNRLCYVWLFLTVTDRLCYILFILTIVEFLFNPVQCQHQEIFAQRPLEGQHEGLSVLVVHAISASCLLQGRRKAGSLQKISHHCSSACSSAHHQSSLIYCQRHKLSYSSEHG